MYALQSYGATGGDGSSTPFIQTAKPWPIEKLFILD
jgi:hypothetical protein